MSPGVLSALAVLSVLSVPLSAQTLRTTGQVINADSAPMPGVPVTLHRVGQRIQGPLDSTTTDRRGRFQFAFRPDSGDFYLASSRYAGIEYFSSPIPTNSTGAAAVRIVVYDTSSTASVEMEARHLVLTRPGDDGSRSVLDIIVLRNPGRATRVAPDTLQGSWSVGLPLGTVGLQVSESDVSPEAVRRAGDSLIVTAALAPGEKQLTIQYQLPAKLKVLELPQDRAGIPLNVLTEERGATVEAPGIQLADSQVVQGRSFQRWTGTSAVGVLRILLPESSRTARLWLPILVGGLALGLLVASWTALASRRSPSRDRSAGALVDAIARLDLRYEGRRAETPDAEWGEYLAERARLKGDLQASLAAGRRSR
jgi:hypothetical protein